MSSSNCVLFCRDSSGEFEVLGDVDATFAWWSFTKTVLSVCALQLVDEALLSLDEEVEDQPFTLRHLLQNTAGVSNYSFLKDYHQAVEQRQDPWGVDEMLRRVDADTLLFAPGEGWSYSNIGFMYISQLIERTLDQGIDDIVRKRIAKPLGLETVRFTKEPVDLEATHWGNETRYHPGWVFHGLLMGSARDAAELLHQLMEGRLLSQEALNVMTREHRLGDALEGRPWRTHGYGLGLMMGDVDGLGPALGHSGAGLLNVAAVYHFPELATPITVAAFAPVENEAVVENFAIETLREMLL